MLSNTFRCGISIVLKDQSHIAQTGRESTDVFAAIDDVARCRRVQSGDQAKRRRLATAARPEQRQKLPFANRQVYRVDRNEVSERLVSRRMLISDSITVPHSALTWFQISRYFPRRRTLCHQSICFRTSGRVIPRRSYCARLMASSSAGIFVFE